MSKLQLIADAVTYAQANPGIKQAVIARKYGIAARTLSGRLSGRAPQLGHKPANATFSEAEEKALCNYIDRLDHINLAVRVEFISHAANLILAERTGADDPPTVGKHWTTRFLKRHGYFKRTQQQLSSNRQSAENLEVISGYFEKLRQTMDQYGFTAADIWNMDETGFRIGVGKDQLIVTKRKRAHYFGLPENRESATAIEAVSAAGRYIPAFLLLTGTVHSAQWYSQPELHPDTAIYPCESGYSNDEISLEWLKHFDKHSQKSQISGYRLLIVDGHGSHHTSQFIQYCDDHNIIPFGLPPHLTHLLQPLDVVCFQPYKHYHAKALDLLVRDGLTNISKLEFLSIIEGVRVQAFKTSTIQSAFQKTGIFPFNPQHILEDVAGRMPRTPSPPAPAPSSSTEATPTTIRQFNKIADRITSSLFDPDLNLAAEDAVRLGRFIKGSLVAANELMQTKRDLGRTKLAERVNKSRRATKNYHLQSGGVLTVADGREMVRKRADAEVQKARRIVQRFEDNELRELKKWHFAAASLARKWRLSGKLGRYDIWETGHERRSLVRF